MVSARSGSLPDRVPGEQQGLVQIDVFRDAGSVDLVGGFASHFPITVIADMFGPDRSGQERISGWYRASVTTCSRRSAPPRSTRCARATGTSRRSAA